MIVQVLENLFLGSLDDAENNDLLKQHDIHAILTIDAKPLMLGIEIQGQCKHLPLLDMSSEDILSHLEETTQYIEGYRSDNKSVLVHWYVCLSCCCALLNQIQFTDHYFICLLLLLLSYINNVFNSSSKMCLPLQ